MYSIANLTGKKNSESIFSFARVALALLAPVLFVISIHLLLASVIGIILLIVVETGEFDEKALSILLFSFLFSGVLIANIHIYDWVLLLIFIIEIIHNRGKVKLANHKMMIVLSVGLMLIFANSINHDSIVDLTRYASAFLSFIVAYNIKNFDEDFLCKKVIEFLAYGMYLAFAVFLLHSRGLFRNITQGIITSEVYLSDYEIRLNGFFTDPNKYFTYTFALICILYFYKREKKYIFLGIVASIISLSRTAIIGVILFAGLLVLKYILQHMSSISRVFFVLLISLLTIGMIIFVFKSGYIDQIFHMVGKILGRSETVNMTSNLRDDNRIKSWRNVLKIIANKPIIGCGLDIIDKRDVLVYATHNTVLQLLAKGGIILFSCYLAFFRKVFSRMNIAIVAFIFVPMLMLDLDTYRLYFILYSLLFI